MLEVQIQRIEETSTVAKQEIWELRQPVKISAQMMQELAFEAATQVNTVFGVVPAIARDEVVTKITAETDALLQGWQQAIETFQELKALALNKVPELGPFLDSKEKAHI